MQLDHVIASGSLVEPIDVLRNDAGDVPMSLKMSDRSMPRIRPRICDVTPPHRAACPIALPYLRGADELVKAYRASRAFAAGRTSIIGNPALGAEARTAENHHLSVAEQTRKLGNLCRRGWGASRNVGHLDKLGAPRRGVNRLESIYNDVDIRPYTVGWPIVVAHVPIETYASVVSGCPDKAYGSRHQHGGTYAMDFMLF